jgi:hypothetical protein
VKLKMDTDFPEGESAKLTFDPEVPKQFTVLLRRPYWVETNFSVAINGEAIPLDSLSGSNPVTSGSRGMPRTAAKESSFVEISRTWKPGDQLTVSLPKTLRLEPLPDNPRCVAISWGPLVLAADLGPDEGRRNARMEAVPVFVAAEKPVTEWLKPVPDKPGFFVRMALEEIAMSTSCRFNRLHRHTYSIYCDLFTPVEWETRAAELAAERERQQRLEAATVGYAQPARCRRSVTRTCKARRPNRFDCKAAQDAEAANGSPSTCRLMKPNPWHWWSPTTMTSGRSARSKSLRTARGWVSRRIERRGPLRFFDVQYQLPGAVTKGKQKVTIRFQAAKGKEIGTVFGVRMIRLESAAGR